MRSMRSSLVAILFAVAVAGPVVAQSHADTFWNAYMAAVMYPEGFDNWVAQNSAARSSGFLSALDRMVSRLYPSAMQEIALCETGDYASTMNCLQNTPTADLYYMAEGIRYVVRGQSRWLDTTRGSMVVWARNMWREVGGSVLTGMTWEETIRFAEAQMRAMYIPYIRQLMS